MKAVPSQRARPWLELLIVLGLLALALGTRLYALPQMPPGLHSDEAQNGLDALDILDGKHAVFFERNNGREPLFIYTQAALVALLGPTVLALRLPSVLFGTATVLATYWMLREAFTGTKLCGRQVAFWTAIFLALSYWHISFSRVGYRVIAMPFFTAVAFGWFWRAWRHLEAGERFPWADLSLSGLFTGASLYTYIAGRVVPLLIMVVVLAGILGARQSVVMTRPRTVQLQAHLRRRAIHAVIVIGAVALMVFLPLGLYFVDHPGSFLKRSVEVSVFNTELTGTDPLRALAKSAIMTAGMFGVIADPTPRQNPAGRPLLDPVLGIWLLAGLAISVVNRRSLPHVFAVAWFLCFALPAVFSVADIPNSLRALGMAPAVYLLPVIAMLTAAEHLARRVGSVAAWLPLPFALFSGFLGPQAYFTAWERNQDILQFAFTSRQIDMIPTMKLHQREDSIWLIPFYPVFALPDIQASFDYFSRGQSDMRYGLVRATDNDAPADLRDITAGQRYADYLYFHGGGLTPDGAYATVDAKRVTGFLLDKYARPVEKEDYDTFGFIRYELPEDRSFRIAGTMTPADLSFGDKLKLTGVSYGHTSTSLQEPAEALDEHWVPSGHPAWVVLRWQAQAPIRSERLKASLFLADQAGHLAGQADDTIRSDHYLFEPVWQAGESSSSYHILPTIPAIPPGHYALYLAVYDGVTQERYPVIDPATRGPAPAALLGSVEITLPISEPVVAPQTLLPAGTLSLEDVSIFAYDLPGSSFGPGDTLPVTLYWKAHRPPIADYQARVRLCPANGGGASTCAQAVAEQTAGPAGDRYPTSHWRAGTVVRDWHDLNLSPSTPRGTYDLVVSLIAGGRSLAEAILQQVEVGGRPHSFTQPAVEQSLLMRVGDDVQLLGYTLDSTAQPGGFLNLTLYWQALDRIPVSYTIFVHVLDSDGRIVAQQDSLPGQGSLSTTSWVKGEFITDSHQVPLDPRLAVGEYSIEVGMYDANTGARLPTTTPDGQSMGDHILRDLSIRLEPE